MTLREEAPAKVNLTLRVLGRRADGFHDLHSLVAFAQEGDVLTLEPGPPLSLSVSGAGASSLDKGDNLVLRAAEALAARIGGLTLGHFHLEKRLPVAAGIGGGSSDAAAALRLLARANRIALDDPRLVEAACAVGSDVPVCLDPRARVMRGKGDVLEPALSLPELPAVLVNPRVATPTPAIFAALGLKPGDPGPGRVEAIGAGDLSALMTILHASANDLEEPAVRLRPEIERVKRALQKAGGAELVRMSGSGATVFALYAAHAGAEAAARHVAAAEPGWWVARTVLR